MLHAMTDDEINKVQRLEATLGGDSLQRVQPARRVADVDHDAILSGAVRGRAVLKWRCFSD